MNTGIIRRSEVLSGFAVGGGIASARDGIRWSGGLRIVVFGLLALGMVSWAGAGSELACDFCRKPIQGRYVVYEHEGRKTTICSTCDSRYPHCQLCKTAFRETPVVVGGETLCFHCAREAVTCNLCNRLIRGSYTVFTVGGEQITVCASCADAAPRCAGCNRPLRAEQVVRTDGKQFCSRCADELPRCGACSQLILGTRFMLRFQPGEYCRSCWETRPACSMCGAPCGSAYSRLDDDRTLCSRCAETAVLSTAKIEEIYAKVKPMLEKELGRPLKHKVTLRLVGPSEIDQMPPGSKDRRGGKVSAGGTESDRARNRGAGISDGGGAPGKHAGREAGARAGGGSIAESGGKTDTGSAAGAAGVVRRVDLDEGRGAGGKELGKFVRRGDEFEIRVLSGQPENWAWETIAHEFAHAWQSEHNPNLNDSAWEEGFAQWAAELVLHEMGLESVLERLRLREDFYGQAFRIVNHYEARRGKAGVIQAVLIMTNEPEADR